MAQPKKSKKVSHRKGSRPTLYNYWTKPSQLRVVEAWRRAGLTNVQIAKNMGISLTTFYEWQKKSSEFADALQKGLLESIAEVENALFKRAVGYRDLSTKIVETFDGDGNLTESKREEVVKIFAPETAAGIFYLRNRANWSNKPEDAVLENLKAEKLKAELELLKAQTDRLSGDAPTPFDDLLADMLMLDDTSEDESDESDDE